MYLSYNQCFYIILCGNSLIHQANLVVRLSEGFFVCYLEQALSDFSNYCYKDNTLYKYG